MLTNFFKKKSNLYIKPLIFFFKNAKPYCVFTISILPRRTINCVLSALNMAGRCAVAIFENVCLLVICWVKALHMVICWLKPSLFTVSKLSFSNIALTFFATASYGFCLFICGLVITGFIVDFKNTFFFFLYYISITVAFMLIYNFIDKLSSIKIISNARSSTSVDGCIIFTIFIVGFCCFSALTGNIYAETLPAAIQVVKTMKPVISSIVKGTTLEFVSRNTIHLDISGQVHTAALKAVFAKSPGILHLNQFSSLVASQTVNVLLELPSVQQTSFFNHEFIGYRDLCHGAHPTSPKPEIIDHYLIKSPTMEGVKAIIVSNKGHLYAGKSGLRLDNYSLIEDLSKPKLLFGEERLMTWIKEILEPTNLNGDNSSEIKKFLNMFPYSFSNLLDPEGTKLNLAKEGDLEKLEFNLRQALKAYENRLSVSQTMMVYAGPDHYNFESEEMVSILKKTGNDFNVFIKTPCLSKIK
jgi:hypothetical protein